MTADCFTTNVDSFGNDVDIKLGTWFAPIGDAEACQQLCQQNTACNYFLYGKDFNIPNLGRRDICWLKSAQTTLTPYTGLVFGPKRCQVVGNISNTYTSLSYLKFIST